MSKKLNLSEKLDFNDIDLTAPNTVIEEVMQQISEQTNDIIRGNIIPYDGHVFSYTKTGYAGLQAVLGVAETHVDIQSTLGTQGEKSKKYEVYLSTPSYEQYKYRICYLKYGVSNYPATIILDQNIVNEITPDDTSYIISCNNRSDVEELFYKIIYSQRVIKVMQELIRINQVQRQTQQQFETDKKDE